MSILVNKESKVLIQGITGTQASFHVKRSMDYGTNVVAGVTPGKGGSVHLDVPVFDTVREAIGETGANASVMYVPAKFVKDAVREAAEAELDLCVCIADGVPIKDMLEIKEMLRGAKTKLIGPNTPGIITPGEARLGIFPENIHRPGRIGVVSRSSTLTYEAVIETNRAGLGQSTVIGLGDDMLIGIDFVETLEKFMNDPDTDAVVVIGQLGGTYEEVCAKYYKNLKVKKPRFFYFQIFVIFGADFFISAAQLSDDDDGIGVRVVHKLFERFDKVNADEHVVAQADDRGLSQPGAVGFDDRFIGKGR